MAETPAQRALHARIASHVRWSREPDRAAATAAARAGLQAKFARQVDPGGVLDPVERARRVANARTAYYLRLAYRSAQARAGRA
jgi:hypothetical protein